MEPFLITQPNRLEKLLLLSKIAFPTRLSFAVQNEHLPQQQNDGFVKTLQSAFLLVENCTEIGYYLQ